MLTARINLEGTNEGDLLLSALVEKSNSYMISINNKHVKIHSTGKDSLKIDTHREKKIMSINVSPEMPTAATDVNARVDVYRKEDNDNGETNIVITLDDPYVVATDSTRKRLIVMKPIDPDDPQDPGNGRIDDLTLQEIREVKH